MQSYQTTLAVALIVAGIAVTSTGSALAQRPTGSKVDMPKFDQPADLANLPMLGTWRINIAKSTFNGSRANSDTFTWVFQVEGDRIRHSIYDVYPADKPSRSYAVKLTGTPVPDPHGPGVGETVSWWPINRSTIFREVIRNGAPSERVIYAVSADGKAFTTTSWSPANPNPTGLSNRMYFDRVGGPTGSD